MNGPGPLDAHRPPAAPASRQWPSLVASVVIALASGGVLGNCRGVRVAGVEVASAERHVEACSEAMAATIVALSEELKECRRASP